MSDPARLRPLEGPRIRGVVFDLDGTLVDSFEALAVAANAARAACDLPPLAVAEVRRHVGHGIQALVRDLVGAGGEARALPAFLEAYDRVCEDGTRALPGAAETLATLRRRGYRSAVASNKPASFSVRILSRLGLGRWLDAIEGPDTAGAAKPDPAMIRSALRAMGCAAVESVYVGDMTLDAASAARAGLAAILVAAPGGESAEALARTGAVVVADLAAILEILPPVSAGA